MYLIYIIDDLCTCVGHVVRLEDPSNCCRLYFCQGGDFEPYIFLSEDFPEFLMDDMSTCVFEGNSDVGVCCLCFFDNVYF